MLAAVSTLDNQRPLDGAFVLVGKRGLSRENNVAQYIFYDIIYGKGTAPDIFCFSRPCLCL